MDLRMDGAALEAFVRAELPLLAGDVAIEEVAPMSLRMRLRVQPQNLRPGGTVSGPAIFALADVAFYLALLSMIGPQALTVTTNASIDFMRKPPAGADLVARARILKLGRVLAVGDVLLFSDGLPDPVARAGMTYSIPPAPA